MVKIPSAILLEIRRLHDQLQRQGVSEDEVELCETQEPSDSIADTLQKIESRRRQARKLLSKYMEHPTPTLAKRVGRLMFDTNILFLCYLIDVGRRSRKRGKQSVPSKWFPFPIPGFF